MTLSLAETRALADTIRAEISKAIVGQEETIEHLIIGLVAQGHVLLEGPPGTAKTFLAQCFAASAGLEVGRIQFTAGGRTHELGPGQLLALGAGLPHAVASPQGGTFLLTVCKPADGGKD